MPRPTLTVLALLTLLPCLPLRAHEVAAEMAQAARTFLDALDAGQRKLAHYPLTDAERENWNFVPLARQGVPFKRLTADQQALGLALLRTGLSHAGQAKAQAIIALELVLKELEKDTKGRRDPTLYYLTFFGEPGPAAHWGWRFEGHHLSFNFTVVGGRHVFFPPFCIGNHPAQVLVQFPHASLFRPPDHRGTRRELSVSIRLFASPLSLLWSLVALSSKVGSA